ncbi:MAG: hypothetical protein ACREDM_05850 [Methylocella sp.]
MERANPRVTTRIDTFSAEGSHAYSAKDTDDDALWRAVELHVFLDKLPAPPPGPVPPQPCPGGRRFRNWSIMIPGGFSVNPFGAILPAAVSGNFVKFRLDDAKPPIVHAFALPGAGFGNSVGTLPLKVKEWLKKILENLSLSEPSWTSSSAETPFNFGDLDGATCNITQISGGVGPALQKTVVSLYGQVWFRESSGKCMFANRDFFTGLDVSGAGAQFNIGSSSTGGPLIRLW